MGQGCEKTVKHQVQPSEYGEMKESGRGKSGVCWGECQLFIGSSRGCKEIWKSTANLNVRPDSLPYPPPQAIQEMFVGFHKHA